MTNSIFGGPAARARFVVPLLLVAAMLTQAARASGQEGGSVALLGGVSQYDLSGVGTVPVVSLRGTTAPLGPVRLEAAITYFSYFTQGNDQSWHIMPEAQLQYHFERAGLSPYIGAGVGASRSSSDVRDETELSLAAALGLRYPMAGRWALVTEFRVRSIDPWTGTTGDWLVGISGPF